MGVEGKDGVAAATAESSAKARPHEEDRDEIHPNASVPTPTYLSPDAATTKVITGRTYRSGALDENIEPISTAGTLPMIKGPCPDFT